jgi:WD40 repeat protein/serine/threonine protein kinase
MSPELSGKPEGDEENLTLVDRDTDNEENQTLIEAISEDKTLLSGEEKTLSEHDRPMSRTWSVREVVDSLYRVEKILTGGMGIIYFIDHLKWGIKLVVKSPREEFLSKENKARFIREAETWVDLGKHPNIATAFYVREMQGIPRIFIEYADGGSLSDWIKEDNLRELPEILDFAIQFCSGMVYAHSKGLVHRDIKSDNVLLMKDGTVKITDFGLVKIKKKDIQVISPSAIEKPSSVSQQEWQTLTSATAVGTPPYMPPEQWIEADKTDRRSDVYSFGVMLYEMICGRRPFVKEPDNPYPTVIAYQMMHRFTPPPDPDQFRDGIPKTLKNLLMKCLEKDSKFRYSSFEEIQDVLVGVYKEVRGKDYERTLPGEAELKAEDLNNRALSYLDLGKKSDARKFLEEAIKIDPHSLCANINLILLFTDEAWDSYENILLRFKSVREGNSGNPLPYYYEAVFELLHGSLRNSLSLIRKSLELDKSNGMFLNFKGIILTDLKKYDEALKAFQEALNFDKENMEYLRNYAASLYYNGRGQEACDEFSKLLDLFPEDPDLKIDLSVAMTGIKKFDRARYLLEEVLKTNPMSIRANLYMGEMLSGTGTFVPSFHSFSQTHDKESALKYLQKASSLAPHVPRVIESLCEASHNKIPLSSYLIRDIEKNERELFYPEAGEITNLKGTGGKITGVSFSGENLAISCSTDSLLELWDLRDGRSIKKFSEESSYMKFEALDVAVSSGYIASAHSDGSVKLWYKKTGDFIRSLYGHTNIVRSIHFSPDGTLLASSGADETVNIWDVESGKSLITAGKNTGIIYCVRFSPDGTYVATGTQKNSLQLWNVKSGDCAKQFYGHNGPVLNIAFSPDGTYIVSGSEDKTLKLWDINKELCVKTFCGHDSSVESVDFSPHGLYIASGCSNGCVKLWDVSTGYSIRTISEHTSSVTSIKFSPSGRNLLTASRDKTLRYMSLPFKGDKIYSSTYRREYLIVKPRTVEESFQDVEAFEKLMSEGEKKVGAGEWKEGHDLFRKALDIQGFSKDGRALSAIYKSGEGGTREGVRSLWLFKTFSDSPGGVRTIDISDNNLIVYGGSDKTIRVKKLETGETLKNFSDSGEIFKVKISREGKFILSGEDKKFKFRDLPTGKSLKILSENLDFKSLNIFPGSFYAVTGGGMTDSTVKIWNIESGECLRTIKGHSSAVETVVLSKDGRFLLSGSDDKTLKLWDVESGKCTGNFMGHTLSVTCSDISPDNKMILSSSQDRTVRIWDVKSEKCLKILKEHRGEVTSVAFSSDGNFIVSGSADNTVRLWNGNGECLRILEGYSSTVTDVKFSSDGRYIITGSMDGTVKIWEIDWNWNFSKERVLENNETVFMKEELVIEAKEELLPDSTTFLKDVKKQQNISTVIGAAVIVLIIIFLAFIPSCIRDSKKGKARFLMKKLYEQKFEPDFARWNMNAKLLLDLGEPGIDVIIDEGLSSSKGMAQMNALKLMEMFKNKDYVREKAKKQLIKLLSDSDPSVRGEAARLIGKYGLVEALPSLKEAMDFENTERWSNVEMELIETKKIEIPTGGKTYSNKTVYYECTSCHGQMEYKPDSICAEARLKPWDYTRNTMKRAIEMLQ